MLKKLIALMFVCSIAHSATYYISPTGNNTTGNGSSSTPWLTLAGAFTHMSGGDTLIVKDGTYTGTVNQITANQRPPSGNAGAWTIIKAEHDGEAIFDGETVRSMCEVTYIGDNGIYDPHDAYASDKAMYYQFEGLLWCRPSGSGPIFQRSRFVKFLRCGTYDTADGGNSNFITNRCADILFENCYSYGSGRYKFLIYCSSSVIVRQCVARMDRCNPTENIALFSMYSAVNCEVQNCIGIDSDQPEDYLNVVGRLGSFGCPSTDADALNVTFSQCVALNNDGIGGITCSGNNGLDAVNVTFDNCVLWDIANGYEVSNYIRGQNDTINHCTFGVFDGIGDTGFNSYDTNGETNATLKNSIIYNFTGMTVNQWPSLIYDIETMDWLSLYANDANNIDNGDIGDHSITNNSPIWTVSNSSGALKYIVRTETGNSLSTLGEGGTQIGANALTLVGVQGTMWGETGYNTDTGNPMWPFPYEGLIKEKFAAYSIHDATYDVDGARGFCATGKQLNGTDDITLTSYIWEYLGNQMPSSVYGITTTTLKGSLTLSGQGTLK